MNGPSYPSSDPDSQESEVSCLPLLACVECGVISSEAYHFLTKIDLCKSCLDAMIHEFASKENGATKHC